VRRQDIGNAFPRGATVSISRPPDLPAEHGHLIAEHDDLELELGVSAEEKDQLQQASNFCYVSARSRLMLNPIFVSPASAGDGTRVGAGTAGIGVLS
jgi:hypothetical protein